MKSEIDKIKAPFLKDLEEYDRVFHEILASNVKLIDTIVKYVVRHKGKRLRPLLVIMSARLVGEATRETYLVAAIIELLHTASLVHDDVVDDAEIRRGFPSINAVWKNKVAVLMGDYMLSKCLIGATDTGKIEVMKILADVSKRLSKGELLQIEKSRKLNISEEEYFEIISNKTAALISAASALGAMSTTNDEKAINNLKSYGENLGIAFQIKDDLLDYYGHQKILGKPVGNDMKDKKITLPLIHAFSQASKDDIKKVKKYLKRGVGKKEIKYIIDFAERHNGIEYAKDMYLQYAARAKESIRDYPETKVREAMYHFVDYVIQRKK
ncbi:MAG TPA: polyprenyl synthetase family protein [Caldithrix abyssi]|uniref:Polyprenyl synthetase family protein n=1 Tax=Caldithrix abyssi TaxID=187145 RepID=A0A7V4UBZ3_CALAY|nr:polyprenyl synthetase family protein [Caldithrix abyssi]